MARMGDIIFINALNNNVDTEINKQTILNNYTKIR